MKRMFMSLIAALIAVSASAATLVPVQLLNPAGSTAGQAIVSTGPSTAPGFANIVVANVTGAAALTGATFSGASGLSYSNATFTLNDTSASNKAQTLFQKNGTTAWALSNSSTANTLAIDRFVSGAYVDSPIQVSNSTGAVTITNGLVASQTAGIVGTTTSNNANAGSVGEYLESFTLATSLTTGNLANLASISLTAGDWDVTGIASFVPAGSTITVVTLAGINTVSTTAKVISGAFQNIAEIWPAQNTPVGTMNLTAPVTRISLAATTTVYLVGQANFSTSTMTANGYLRARRVR